MKIHFDIICWSSLVWIFPFLYSKWSLLWYIVTLFLLVVFHHWCLSGFRLLQLRAEFSLVIEGIWAKVIVLFFFSIGTDPLTLSELTWILPTEIKKKNTIFQEILQSRFKISFLSSLTELILTHTRKQSNVN